MVICRACWRKGTSQYIETKLEVKIQEKTINPRVTFIRDKHKEDGYEVMMTIEDVVIPLLDKPPYLLCLEDEMTRKGWNGFIGWWLRKSPLPYREDEKKLIWAIDRLINSDLIAESGL